MAGGRSEALLELLVRFGRASASQAGTRVARWRADLERGVPRVPGEHGDARPRSTRYSIVKLARRTAPSPACTVEQLVELQRRAVARGRCRSPRTRSRRRRGASSRDAELAQEVDARVLEVQQVARVMHDPHRVGLVEAHAALHAEREVRGHGTPIQASVRRDAHSPVAAARARAPRVVARDRAGRPQLGAARCRLQARQRSSSGLDGPTYVTLAARRHAPVRRRADGPDPHRARTGSCSPTPFADLGEARDGRWRAGAARPRLPPALRDERPALRLLHGARRSTSRSGSCTRRPAPTRSRAPRRLLLDMADPFSNHNGGDLRVRAGRRTSTSGRATAARAATRGAALAEHPRSPLGKLLRIDVDRRPSGRPYGIPADNPFAKNGAWPPAASTRGACATRGATRSTARRATSGSATSARTRGRRSTTSRRGKGRGANFGWSRFEGTHLFDASHRADARRPPGLARRPVLALARAARSRAATSTAARRSPGSTGATCTPTTAARACGRSRRARGRRGT